MEERKGIEYLRRKLERKQTRIRRRYRYYEMKSVARDLQISTPPNLRAFSSSLGWCAKAVDALAERLHFTEFESDSFGMTEIYRMNNGDILTDSAMLSALICACSFIYVSEDENGDPRLQVIDGSNATGIIDEQTYLLTEGYAVLLRDDRMQPVLEAYFTPEETVFYRRGEEPTIYRNPTGHPLLVPVIYKPDYKRPFGHSRISRACMDYTDMAVRTMKRSEISAEFYSFPQKYVVGMSPDADPLDTWRATMSSMLRFDKDEDGDKPTLGSFTQQSMEPHIAQLRMVASLFSGETGLTMDDLGFPSENPSSAEAIKAAHETLRLTARKAQRDFGIGFLNAGFLAACIRDKEAYARNMVYDTVPAWEPVFEPDMAMLAGVGDAASKINQAVPGFFDAENLRKITGIKGGEDAGYSTGAAEEDIDRLWEEAQGR